MPTVVAWAMWDQAAGAEQPPVRWEAGRHQRTELCKVGAQERGVVAAHPDGVEVLVVRGLLFHQDDHLGESGPHQFKVHQQPGGAPVAVRERVNPYEVGMDARGRFHGMQARRRIRVPPEKGVHALLHMQGIATGKRLVGHYATAP